MKDNDQFDDEFYNYDDRGDSMEDSYGDEYEDYEDAEDEYGYEDEEDMEDEYEDFIEGQFDERDE